jgi:single-strand DNA-binding protein
MKSFKVFAAGNLASDPEVIVKGDKSHTRFCLIGNDYAGRDEAGNAKEIATSVYFVAFNGMGEAIARNLRKGDQLILEAHIRANNWTDDQQQRHFDHSYIVDSFKFGAKGRLSRDEQAQRQDSED